VRLDSGTGGPLAHPTELFLTSLPLSDGHLLMMYSSTLHFIAIPATADGGRAVTLGESGQAV
jgi:hypothetical protein